MNCKRNRVVSGLLSFAMIFTLVFAILQPIEVHAAAGGEGGLEITSPSDGDTINGFETIRIKWNKYSGADHYWITIKDEKTGDKPVNEEYSGTTYRVYSDDEVFTENDREYKIYVAAMDEDGNVLENGAAWHAIYVTNELELETPEITSHGYLDTHCVDDSLYVSWDAVDGADDYTVYVKKLNGDPDYGSSNESGTNITYTWSDDCEIKVATSKLVADKWYKIALCATNTDQDIDSEWTEVYILMEESSYLNVSEYPDDLDATKGSTGSFWIESNLDWDISCDVSWLTWTINQVDDIHAEIIVTATSANTGTSEREAEFTISADGVDDEYVYVTQLAPEIELPSFSNVTISGNVSLGEKITWSADVNGNGALLETVSVGIYSKQLDDSVFFRNVNIDEETYSLSGSVVTGGVVSGYDASGNAKTLDMSLAGEYTVTIHAATDAAFNNYAATEPVTITLTEPVGTGILGDVNSDGKVTNMDRFILNRYLLKMSGYSTINKENSDIDGDGNITENDCTILSRHLAKWVGYEDLNIFHKEPEETPFEDTSKWEMSFSANAVTMEVELVSGTPDSSKDYLFIAEDKAGLHYVGYIDAGSTSASFSVKSLQMPRGEMYSFYVIPDGIVLAGNEDRYCIGKSVVPLFKGNMITSVKSGDRTVAKGGNVFLGDSLTIGWDGSFGVNNFELTVTLNGSEIYKNSFDHDGPGVVTINGSKLSQTGSLIITGTVYPSSSSGLAPATTTWSGNVIEIAVPSDVTIDPISLLNDEALALYNKRESISYLKLDTYYYWQAFSDELTTGTHWGSKWEGVRADISNIVNGIFSSPTTLVSNGSEKALIKQAIRSKLRTLIGYDEDIRENISDITDIEIPLALKQTLDLQSVFIGGSKYSDLDLLDLIEKIDFRSFNNNNTAQAIKNVFSNLTYKNVPLTEIFDITDENAASIKHFLQAISDPKLKETEKLERVKVLKNLTTFDFNNFLNAMKLDALDYVDFFGKFLIHVDDIMFLCQLNIRFNEIEEELSSIVGASTGVFKEAMSETFTELKRDIIKQVLSETGVFLATTAVDVGYGKIVTYLAQRVHPIALITVVANGLITGLADTDTINKGELTLPYIVEAMNNTVSKISYTYSLFMTNPTNTLYYELAALFNTYEFQVHLGAEIYYNISMADYNSYLKRFARFINPFDKDDSMPDDIQKCFDKDIEKLDVVLDWFGFGD